GGDYLLTSINQEDGGWGMGTFWTMIVDRKGRPVWALETPQERWTMFAQVAVTGDRILWDANSYWSDWDDGALSRVYRRYLDEEIDSISTPGLHHAFVQLPDGTLVWGSQDHGGYEALVEQPLGETEQTVLWSCWADWPDSGDCKSNGLFYSQERDTFLYSFYTNDSIVEVDHSTGQSLWWAGEVPDGFEFAEGSQQFNWQHGISYTDTGSILLSSRVYGSDAAALTTALVVTSQTTEAIEYTVDYDLGVLTEIWSYSPGVYAGTNGDTWRLANGNTLHTLGSAGHVFEVDPDGVIVWHLDMLSDHMMGRSHWLDDPYALLSPGSAG
ncbi:MAG: hypothetical protein GXP62_11780, partial [Oligoflexia bacterium]|nr:hypothetical protein [Oligoflexia bacterium]